MKTSKLHCKKCGCMRQMRVGFLFAADEQPTKSDNAPAEEQAEQQAQTRSDKHHWIFVNNKKLRLGLKQDHVASHLPRGYAGFCPVCGTTTFYERNKQNKLVALNV